MLDRNTFYLILKATALAAVVLYQIPANAESGFFVAPALAFCCLFSIGFLLVQYGKTRVVKLICPLIGLAGCFFCGAEDFFPLLLMLLFELLDLLGADRFFYALGAACTVLLLAILKPPIASAVTALVLTAAGMAVRALVEKLAICRALIEEQRKAVAEKNEKIAKLKSYAKTLRETTALEERNRFSARIHDKLGHGISGSIILLEGARLSLRSDPEKAEQCLETAAENLRSSVDSIREALHEERPKRFLVGEAALKEALERFSVSYGIRTEYAFEGDAALISPQIWSCLLENLTESLTNTVKHSSAERFSLRVSARSGLIRAEFSDNGSCGGQFVKGMGLEAIEDRTAVCGGKCFFRSGHGGFRTINVFYL